MCRTRVTWKMRTCPVCGRKHSNLRNACPHCRHIYDSKSEADILWQQLNNSPYFKELINDNRPIQRKSIIRL